MILIELLVLFLINKVQSVTVVRKYESYGIAPWQPMETFQDLRTLIDCSHICEDDEYCLMFHWDESSSSCELGGSSNEFKHVEGGKISYVYPQYIYIGLYIYMYTYDAYEMENVVVNLYQSNNPSKTWSGVTDAEGHVEFIEMIPSENLTVTVSHPGYQDFEQYIILRSDHYDENVTFTPSPTLNDPDFRCILNWAGEPYDIDLRAVSVDDEFCEASPSDGYCMRNGGNAMIEYHYDQFDFGHEGGEAISWTGTFLPGEKFLIFSNTSNALLDFEQSGARLSWYDASNSVTIYPVTDPNPPGDPIDYWLVGCIDPGLGLNSFTELNQYATELDTSVCA